LKFFLSRRLIKEAEEVMTQKKFFYFEVAAMENYKKFIFFFEEVGRKKITNFIFFIGGGDGI
jgi:hypothetical protein